MSGARGGTGGSRKRRNADRRAAGLGLNRRRNFADSRANPSAGARCGSDREGIADIGILWVVDLSRPGSRKRVAARLASPKERPRDASGTARPGPSRGPITVNSEPKFAKDRYLPNS